MHFFHIFGVEKARKVCYAFKRLQKEFVEYFTLRKKGWQVSSYFVEMGYANEEHISKTILHGTQQRTPDKGMGSGRECRF